MQNGSGAANVYPLKSATGGDAAKSFLRERTGIER